MTRYLLTGASGMLGTDVAAALAGREVTALSRAQLDITDEAAVREAIAGHDVVINTAAHTKVDEAESHEDEALAANAVGPGILARTTAESGATLVHFSTDYVFDGHASTPYPEDAPRDPASAYGRTKAEGERRVLAGNPERSHVIRIAWLYGENGPNFPRTMLRLAGERETLEVVTDQVGQPTWTADVARRVVDLLDTGAAHGVWHATNSGQASWYDLARATFELAGLDPDRVRPTESSLFVRPAPRPSYSVLGHDAWRTVGLEPMRHWKNALSEAFRTGALGAA